MKSSSPLVSIGLPVYNGSRYLGEAITSVLAQTEPDFELIVADNASTDDSASIAERYAREDPRIRLVRHPTNIGGHRNFRFTLAEATGEFFKWAAHDDLLAPTFLEETLGEFRQKPDLSLVFCDMAVIDEEGALQTTLTMRYDYMGPSPYQRFRQFFGETLRGEQVFGLTRTDLIRSTGQLADAPGSDVTLVAELLLRGPMSLVAKPLFLNRDHGERYTRVRTPANDYARDWFGAEGASTAAKDLNRFRWYRAGIARSSLEPMERAKCEAFMLAWLVRISPRIVQETLAARGAKDS